MRFTGDYLIGRTGLFPSFLAYMPIPKSAHEESPGRHSITFMFRDTLLRQFEVATTNNFARGWRWHDG